MILLFFIVCSELTLKITPLISAEKNDPRLKNTYEFFCTLPSDINEHLPVLKDLASNCNSAIEIGIRNIVSTWAILQGLSESNSDQPLYLGIDLVYPPKGSLSYAKNLAQSQGISFNFWKADDMKIEIEPVDLLFIDSLHTYCHLTYELEKFSSKVNKYIALHDTSAPWGNQDDNEYHGNYSEYPKHIDRNKRGLWPAVEDFLSTHPEWALKHRYFNNHGFTILERVSG